MNPFDTAWDFFKAADRLSIADPSASKGSSGGHLQPYDKALGDKADEMDRKKQSDKKYLAEMASAAPDSPPPPTEGDPRTEEIYEDLPDEAFPQSPPLEAPKSRGNPRGYFQMSEPFDAAWALLKQWEDTDWTGDEHQQTADDWAGVDWSQQPTMGGNPVTLAQQGEIRARQRAAIPPPRNWEMERYMEDLGMNMYEAQEQQEQALLEHYENAGRLVGSSRPFPPGSRRFINA